MAEKRSRKAKKKKLAMPETVIAELNEDSPELYAQMMEGETDDDCEAKRVAFEIACLASDQQRMIVEDAQMTLDQLDAIKSAAWDAYSQCLADQSA